MAPSSSEQAVDQTSDPASGLSSIQSAKPRGSRSVVVQLRLGASTSFLQIESKPAIEALRSSLARIQPKVRAFGALGARLRKVVNVPLRNATGEMEQA